MAVGELAIPCGNAAVYGVTPKYRQSEADDENNEADAVIAAGDIVYGADDVGDDGFGGVPYVTNRVMAASDGTLAAGGGDAAVDDAVEGDSEIGGDSDSDSETGNAEDDLVDVEH